jgi:hypothetical protein
MGGKKRCSAILASPPSEDKPSQLPRFPHLTHKKDRMAEILSSMLPLEPLLPIEVDNIRS